MVYSPKKIYDSGFVLEKSKTNEINECPSRSCFLFFFSNNYVHVFSKNSHMHACKGSCTHYAHEPCFVFFHEKKNGPFFQWNCEKEKKKLWVNGH